MPRRKGTDFYCRAQGRAANVDIYDIRIGVAVGNRESTGPNFFGKIKHTHACITNCPACSRAPAPGTA